MNSIKLKKRFAKNDANMTGSNPALQTLKTNMAVMKWMLGFVLASRSQSSSSFFFVDCLKCALCPFCRAVGENANRPSGCEAGGGKHLVIGKKARENFPLGCA